MKLDVFASLPHYASHIQPIWERMPFEHRGQWFTPANPPRATGNLMLVAGFRDAEAVGNRPLILHDHGAGQSYDGDPRAAGNGSYSGGEGLGQVVLFLCPSERVAHRWRQTYGATRAVAVGCPRLDRWSGTVRTTATADGLPASPTVAVTFHWECSLVPETRSAWRHYDSALPALCADPRWRVLGHGHPRLWPTIRRRWERLGVEHTPDVDEVLGRADLLVVDNSSVGFEAAAIGIPVLCLNIPSYRRDVEHGGRFWSSPAGIQCDRPADLLDSVAEALADGPAARRIRARAVEWAYSAVDGCASERAVAAIMEVMHRG